MARRDPKRSWCRPATGGRSDRGPQGHRGMLSLPPSIRIYRRNSSKRTPPCVSGVGGCVGGQSRADGYGQAAAVRIGFRG